MCGIVGRVGGQAGPLTVDEVKQAIGHRGPDDARVTHWSARGVTTSFGHTRLSIVDLSEAGAQPMESTSGRWLLTFNGEIYNHGQLREELTARFRGHCDTETVVEALDAWGVQETVRRLNGIFAFAALDKKEGRVHLARDPFGVKPLYYTAVNGVLAFSSELRGVAAATGATPAVDLDGLRTFLAYRFVPSPLTCWRNVHRLPPGHILTYDLEGRDSTSACYVEFPSTEFQGSESEAVDEYARILSEAVRLQLLSDVPLGVLLSGGVDSAMVAALGQRHGGDLRSFTVGFGSEYEECELDHARHTAEILDLSHQEVVMTSESAWASLTSAVAAVEEPLGTTSILPMWHVAELAGRHVKAVLTGQGSDEPWGGYRRYQGALLAGALPPWLPWTPLAKMATRLPHGLEFVERGLRTFSGRSVPERLKRAYALFTCEEQQRLGIDGSETSTTDPLQAWLTWANEGRALRPVEQMMAIDARLNLADDLLLYGDKITMAHGLEARVPVLDIEVMRFVESLPRTMRVRLGETKIVHKRAARRLLPDSIVNRRKLGFQVPLGNWFRREWRQRTEDYLLDRSGKLATLVDVAAVEGLWLEHRRGKRDRTRQLFALLGLAIWAGRFG